MSASLVGSEMCIRDRATSSRLCCPKIAAAARAPAHRRRGQRQLAEVAVSYTHLTLPTICSV
eukprot:5123316-Alexandrium_andersonii.AAC.1